MVTEPMRAPAVPVALEDPALNRGVAFTAAEREALGLTGGYRPRDHDRCQRHRAGDPRCAGRTSPERLI